MAVSRGKYASIEAETAFLQRVSYIDSFWGDTFEAFSLCCNSGRKTMLTTRAIVVLAM